jgi:hypothetical protein
LKRKRIVLIVTAIVLLIAMIATGYTFSKYYQASSGKVSVMVAPWRFKVTTNSNRALSQITLQGESGTLTPGDSGSFEINIDATGSGVDVAYTTTVTNENLPAGLKFYLSGSDNATKYETFKELADAELNGVLVMSKGQTKYYTVCWEWPFDGDDTDSMSEDGDFNYGFNIEVTGEQVKKG